MTGLPMGSLVIAVAAKGLFLLIVSSSHDYIA